MAIISLGRINKKILFAVFGGLFKCICNIILYHSKSKISTHPCILGINAGIGLSLAIFPLIFIKIRSKYSITSIKNCSNILTKEPLIYTDTNIIIYETKIKRKLFYIFIISLLDFSQKFLSFFFVQLFLENFWIFDSFLLLVFSLLILKEKFYAHHLVSLIFIMILGIILISFIYYNKEVNFWVIIVTLLTEILYSLEDVIFKYTMKKKFSSPYEICFFAGVFEIIIYSLLLIIFSNVPIKSPNYFNKASDDYIDSFSMYNEKIDFIEVFLFILSMLSRGIFILFGFITIDYFTPLHIVLIIIIGEISFLYIDVIDLKLYVKIPIFVLLIFFILIFVEILELNIFGLQKNTKKNIIQRANIEEEVKDKRRESEISIDLEGSELQRFSLISNNEYDLRFLI